GAFTSGCATLATIWSSSQSRIIRKMARRGWWAAFTGRMSSSVKCAVSTFLRRSASSRWREATADEAFGERSRSGTGEVPCLIGVLDHGAGKAPQSDRAGLNRAVEPSRPLLGNAVATPGKPLRVVVLQERVEAVQGRGVAGVWGIALFKLLP